MDFGMCSTLGFTLADWVSLGGLLSAVVGIGFALIQISLLRRQLRLDALIKIMDANREIVSIGMGEPSLWESFEEGSGVVTKAKRENRRRFFQLWINQMTIIWSSWDLGLLSRQEWQAFRHDIAETMSGAAMRERWGIVQNYYPRDFRDEMNRLADEARQSDKTTPQRG